MLPYPQAPPLPENSPFISPIGSNSKSYVTAPSNWAHIPPTMETPDDGSTMLAADGSNDSVADFRSSKAR